MPHSFAVLLGALARASAEWSDWITQFGTASDDGGTCVSSDSSNDVVVGGYTYGDLYGTNAGDKDLIIAKLSSGGSFLWGWQFGTSLEDKIRAIAVDGSDNIFAAGYVSGTGTEGDPYIVKLGSDGTELWSSQRGDPSVRDNFNGMTMDDATGDVVAVGASLGTIDGVSSTGFTDFLIMRFDSAAWLTNRCIFDISKKDWGGAHRVK